MTLVPDELTILVNTEIAIDDTARRPLVEGQMREFALELSPIHLAPDGVDVPGIEPLGGAQYWIRGEAVYVRDGILVVDFGIKAYCSFHEIPVGSYISGITYLAMDNYLYMEAYHKMPGIPPLVYTWHIDRYDYDTLTGTRLPVAPKWLEENGIQRLR